jgi:hypothetical protein
MPPGRPRKNVEKVVDIDEETRLTVKGTDVTEIHSCPMPEPPSLDLAFSTLCKALLNNHLEDLPDIAYVREIQMRYSDSHHALAWKQIWNVLEGVVGTPQ